MIYRVDQDDNRLSHCPNRSHTFLSTSVQQRSASISGNYFVSGSPAALHIGAIASPSVAFQFSAKHSIHAKRREASHNARKKIGALKINRLWDTSCMDFYQHAFWQSIASWMDKEPAYSMSIQSLHR
ncbi:hypothetical protein ISN75_20950 [Dyella marensis]|uniref:hypothetical protein n=1 Tax=Dyella marensis TaxID=500610 RepID=UPI0031DC6800